MFLVTIPLLVRTATKSISGTTLKHTFAAILFLKLKSVLNVVITLYRVRRRMKGRTRTTVLSSYMVVQLGYGLLKAGRRTYKGSIVPSGDISAPHLVE